MAHIAFITNGLTGLLFASFEMVRRLRAHGHHITYWAPELARDAVIREGLPFHAIPDFQAKGVTESDMDQIAENLDTHSPDLALIDTELPEVVLAAQAACLQTVLLNTWMSIWQHPGLPPLHRSIQPGVGWHGSSIGVNLAWTRHRLTRRMKHIVRRCWHGRKYRVTRLRAYSNKIGFPHTKEFDFDNWLLPFSFRSLPILTLHAHELDFPHTPRDHVHYVGPMVNPNRQESPSHATDLAIVEAVLSRRQSSNTRLIYGGFGSHFIADDRLLSALFSAFSEQREWELIAPLGDRVSSIDVSKKPANVHLVTWAPQLALLQHADAAIIHGGINTIDECIHYKTPMLACSGGMTDMPGNIARVVHHRLGLSYDVHRDSPEAVTKSLDRVMTDPDIKESLKAQQSAAERYAKDKVLECIIDGFLEGDLASSAGVLTLSRSASPQAAASRT